jgi:hypothetical protein
MNNNNLIETDAIDTWLALWSTWLDRLIVTGIDSIATEPRKLVENWLTTAELLGFHSQALLTAKLLDENLTVQTRSQVFYQLLLEQDLLKRLYQSDNVAQQYAQL